MIITSRQVLNPNIKWYQPTDQGWHVLTYEDFVGGIDQWKNIFYEMGNLRPGQKFGVGSSRCDYVCLTAILAGLEMGAKIIVMPYNLNAKKMLAPIQTWAHEDGDAKAVNDGVLVGSNVSIPWSTFYTFTSKFNTFGHLEEYFPTQEKIAVSAVTSGTSGTPKVCEYPHSLFDAARNRSIKIFNLQKDDRVLHLSNMHHGGTSGVFFFPSLYACEHHYYGDGLNFNKLPEIIDLIKDQKITKAMFPNNLLVDRFLDQVGHLDHDFEIYVNQANSKTWIEKAKKANIKSINSLFGSTETMGPIFLNSITRDTDEGSYNPLDYGKLFDDHFTVTVTDTDTRVVVKNYKTETLNDLFSIDDRGHYIFRSRTNILRIHDVDLSFTDVERININYLKNHGVIVPDVVTNKIYCLIEPGTVSPDVVTHQVNQQLGQISNLLKVDYVEIASLSQFIMGIKLSFESIREFFRKKYNLL